MCNWLINNLGNTKKYSVCLFILGKSVVQTLNKLGNTKKYSMCLVITRKSVVNFVILKSIKCGWLSLGELWVAHVAYIKMATNLFTLL